MPRSARCPSLRWLARCLAVACLGAGAVRSAPAEENWLKVAAEHFTILTPASASVAQARAIELEQFRRALQAIIPVPPDRLRPVTVVLFKDRRSMESYLPLENGQPKRLAGYFARTNDLNTIILSLDGDDAEARHVVFHEAVHWHVNAFEGRMPPWVDEGLAELYATFELVDDTSYRFGSPIAGHVALLRREKFLPLSELLDVRRDSLLYNEGSRTSIFYAQAWALLHFLFYGERSPGREAVGRFLAELPRAASTEAAFRSAFGLDYAAMEQRLREYIDRGTYARERYARTTDDIARRLTTTAAAPGEIALARGSLLLAASRPADAAAHLRQAAEHAPRDPRAWELLGHLAVARKDMAAARTLLARAAEAGSKSYLVYYNLAVTHLPEDGPSGFVSAPAGAESDQAAALYRRAIALGPSHVPSYEGLAGLMQCTKTFVPGDLDVLTKGHLLAPDNVIIPVGIAIAEIRSGRVVEGLRRLESVLARVDNESARGVAFARHILAGELLQADVQQINERAKERKYTEAIAIVDHAFARPLPPGHRETLEGIRRQLAAYRTITQAIAAANRGESAAAKALLEQVLAERPEPAIAAEANRVLGELARSSERRLRRTQ